MCEFWMVRTTIILVLIVENFATLVRDIFIQSECFSDIDQVQKK